MPATPIDMSDWSGASQGVPPLPAGELVHLDGRGSVFVRQLPGPPGAPVLMLLHGWTATADLNWYRSYRALGRHFRIVAFDHRGHGLGMRTDAGFRLEDCADDVAAIATALEIEQFIPVGYSMGGPIAKLVWRHHPHMVQGLVLCATSRHFADSPAKRVLFGALNGTSVLTRSSPYRALGRLSSSAWTRRLERRGHAPWMIEQVLRHDWTQVLEAGKAIGRFDSREWAGEIDVPTAVVVSLDDEVVPTRRQFELARAVPDASVHSVPGGHGACIDPAGDFVASLTEACHSVVERIGGRSPILQPILHPAVTTRRAPVSAA
jgi:3-oxoadipate enol-lactonase